jgi:hypothetical protein
MVMTRWLALAVVLLALVGASPASSKSGAFYAFRYGAKMNVLVPYDPVRVVPSGPVIRMGQFAQAWSISPDRSHLVAAASRHATDKGGSTALRFVDLVTGRIEGTLSLRGESRRVTATAWIRGRVLVIVSGASSTTAYSVDPERRATISKVEFPGTVLLGERVQSGVVLLLAQPDRIGPVTLALVDQSPHVRTVLLDKITAGTTSTGVGMERRMTVRRPGLALSPSLRRAYVLAAREPAASIDLRTLAVRYSPQRLITVATKRVDGSVRVAATLPDGRIVVTGSDYGAARNVGISLVDPKDWSRRVLDATTDWFRVAGGLVFARGEGNVGLRILRPSGPPVSLFRTGSVGNVFVVGPRAFVTFFGTHVKAAVVELGTRRVVRHTVPAHPLLGAGQPIVD